MTRKFSLSHATVHDLSPVEVASVAAAVGYDSFGLRLFMVRPDEVPPPLYDDTTMRRELRAIIADTGVPLFDIDAVKLDAHSDFVAMERAIEAGASLGAQHALTFIAEKEMARAADLFGRFCDISQRYGLVANLEFMPWMGVSTLSDALHVQSIAGRANSKIVPDVLHFFRSGTPLAALESLPRSSVAFAHVCDAPAEPPPTLELVADEARHNRQYPGDGQLPVQKFIAALAHSVVLSPEVPTLDRSISGHERAERALHATRQLIQ